MKKLIVLFILALTPAVTFFSCKHDPVLPEHEVSFSSDILPIIQQGCWHAGCHGDSLNQQFKLTDYEKIMDKGEIEPGDPHDSKLYEVITAPDGDEDRMPREPYPRLTERQVKLIYIWIAQGAKNN
ncbi:MAG TPA: hypothetical protein VK826_14505 [Bacteroidia bacterium]|nr:hypothetical protein [Bacteroidia bacterium]